MTEPARSSEISQQLLVLNAICEEQRQSPTPNTETDLKCAVEMKKLLTTVEEVKKSTGSLDPSRESKTHLKERCFN